MAMIYPSLMRADILNLQREIERLDPYCPGYQLDIMDNKFVPVASGGTRYVNAIASITYKRIWVHLMVEEPREWLDKFFLPDNSIISFHFEAKSKINETIKAIKDKKWAPSLAINPETSIEVLFPHLDMLHQVLLMSVEPGFSGQEFLESTWERLRTLIGYRETSGLPFRIGVDGGINSTNIVELVRKGADDLAISSAIFDKEDAAEALKELSIMAVTVF